MFLQHLIIWKQGGRYNDHQHERVDYEHLSKTLNIKTFSQLQPGVQSEWVAKNEFWKKEAFKQNKKN